MDTQQLRKFVAPEFVFGPGARHLAGTYARNLGGRKVLVVTDAGVAAAGWVREVTSSLRKVGISPQVFSRVSSNPRADEVHAGAEIFRQERCNLILAVGGGSPIDCAKAIGILATNSGSILDYRGVDQISNPLPPLICIPTTCGSSADVSQFAIITDPEKRAKVAIVSKAVVPDLALIDPETLTTLSPYLTACVGMDALTHGIEAYVSSAHSPITDLHALEAIRLLTEHLAACVAAPHDQELRARVMLGSLHAGLAFSNAILGATHALAHSLGGYLDLPHGECNAILLDRVIEFNYPAVPERFDQIARSMGLDLHGRDGEGRKQALAERVRNLKEQIGLHRRLSSLGVAAEDIPGLSRKALRDPCLITNPRKITLKDIQALYEKTL